ncbi:hypothetical protein KFE25_003141 [Diacronema lutheri]|uniref:Cyclic nucleotide-binding domain-containing protein n=1 Tax=Diacronema lutheri TaxID=2081491 RepID=A0A8J5X996_DIALT|nr:hypothetical protein KFE25_003141 [Diacronema lutheri]
MLVDVMTIVLLHTGRALYALSGYEQLFVYAQIPRLTRVVDLGAHVQALNSNLATNVTFLSVFKFGLVLLSVPHWIACLWLLVSPWGPDGHRRVDLPAWPAQIAVLSNNPSIDPNVLSDGERYLIATHMSYAGLAGLGYEILFTRVGEMLLVMLVALAQIVFYAFVLGTLFNYLVRTDENTVAFKSLLKAVDEFALERKLPAPLVGRIVTHFRFQHSKQSSATDRIFAQMPRTLQTEVASAQYAREVGATWVFHGVTPQFLNAIVLQLRERYMPPRGTVFRKGDGSLELLWCVGGTLHVRKGDALITTIRADIGPGQVVGELAFFAGIPQPYTVQASARSEVTLVVLPALGYDEIVASYPEQLETIMVTVLRKFGLNVNGSDYGAQGGALGEGPRDKEEEEEFNELREAVRVVIIARNEERLAQMAAAVRQGDVESIKALCAAGFDANMGDYDSRTALHVAAASGHLAVVTLLLELDADVQRFDRWNDSPIRVALEGRHGAVVEALRAHGAVLHFDHPAMRLHAAVRAADMNHIALLLQARVDVNAGDHDRRTALHIAAADGNVRIAEHLISALADVNASDRWGLRPIDEAIDAQQMVVTQLLLRSSARPDAAAVAPKLRAACMRADVSALHFFINTGLPLPALVAAAPHYDGRTALHYAALSGSDSTASLLIGALLDVNACDGWGRPALADALEISDEISALLLRAGASLPANLAQQEHLAAALERARAVDVYPLMRLLLNLHKVEGAVHSLRTLWHDAFASARALSKGEKDRRQNEHDALIELLTHHLELDETQAAIVVIELYTAASRLVSPDVVIGRHAAHASSDTFDGKPRLFASASACAQLRSGSPLALLSFCAAVQSELHSAQRRTARSRNASRTRVGGGSGTLSGRVIAQAASAIDASRAPGATADGTGGLAALSGGALRLSGSGHAGERVESEPVYISELGVALLFLAPSFARAICTPPTPRPPPPTDTPAAPTDGRPSPSVRRSVRVSLKMAACTAASFSRPSARRSAEGRDDHAAMLPPVSPPPAVPGASLAARATLTRAASVVDAVADPVAAREPEAGVSGGEGAGIGAATSAQQLPTNGPDGVSWVDRVRRSSWTNKQSPSGAASKYRSRKTSLLEQTVSSMPDGNAGGGRSAWAAKGGLSALREAAAMISTIFDAFDTDRADVLELRALRHAQGALAAGEHRGRGSVGAAGARAGGKGARGGDGSGGTELNALYTTLARTARALAPAAPELAARVAVSARRGSGSVSRSPGVAQREASVRAGGSPGVPRHGDAPGAAGRGGSPSVPRQGSCVGGSSQTGSCIGARPQSGSCVGGSSQTGSCIGSTWRRASCRLLAQQSSVEPQPAKADEDAESRASPSPSGSVRFARAPRALDKLQFLAGVATWVACTRLEDADAAAHASGEDGADAARRDEREPADRGGTGGVGADETVRGPALALDKLRDLEGSGTDETPAAALTTAAAETAAAAGLRAALASAGAFHAIAQSIELRLSTQRLAPADRPSAAELLPIVHHALTVPPLCKPRTLADFFARELGIELLPGADSAAAAAIASSAAEAEAPTWRALARLLTEAAQSVGTLGRAGALTRAAADGADGVGGALAGAGGGAGGDSHAKPWFILSVSSRAHHRLHGAFVLLVFVDCVALPCVLAFIRYAAQMPWLRPAALCIDCVYWLLIVVRLHTSFINSKSVEVTDPRECRSAYLAGAFALDVLGCLPINLAALSGGASVLLFFQFRLLRFVNVRYAVRAYRSWQRTLVDDSLGSGVLSMLFLLSLLLHLLACTLEAFAIAPISTYGGRNWLSAYQARRQDVQGRPLDAYVSAEEGLLDNYLSALLLAMQLLTAMGVEQLPQNLHEFGLYIAVMLINLTFFAYVVGQLSTIVMRQDDEVVSKRAQLELVNGYIASIRVPKELKGRLTKLFRARLKSTSLSSVSAEVIYQRLPMELQIEVAAHTYRAIVVAASLLRGTSAPFIDRLSSLLTERTLDAETVVFQAAAACDELFFVATGALQVYDEAEGGSTDNVEISASFGVGETLDDVAFIFNIRHVSSARTAPDGATKLFVLHRRGWLELLKTFPGQEDIIMENAISAHEGDARGNATARSARSHAAASEGGGAAGAARSEYGSAVSVAHGGRDAGEDRLQAVVTAAKRKRADLYHTRLCSACARAELGAAKRVLASSAADVNARGPNKRTALHLGACGGSVPLVRLLLAARAEVNATDARGSTPLTDALDSGHADVASLLARHGGVRGASVDAPERMCQAPRRPDGVERLRSLAAFGGDLGARNAQGRTALHVAAAEGRLPCVEFLVQANVNVNAADALQRTPLREACIARHDACADALLARGAHLGRAFDAGLHLNQAVFQNDTAHLARLIRCRCSVNSADDFGRTPLHVAVSRKRVSAVHHLLQLPAEVGANINAEDVYGHTAYDDAERVEAGTEPRVLCTLVRAAGGVPGSGVRRAHAQGVRGAGLEEGRIAKWEAFLLAEEARLSDAREIEGWVRDEALAVVELRSLVDRGVTLERDEGSVLADRAPELFESVQAFADAQRAQLLIARRALETVRAWAAGGDADTSARGVATAGMKGAGRVDGKSADFYAPLVAKLNELVAVHESDEASATNPLVRLQQTTFRLAPSTHLVHANASVAKGAAPSNSPAGAPASSAPGAGARAGPDGVAAPAGSS